MTVMWLSVKSFCSASEYTFFLAYSQNHLELRILYGFSSILNHLELHNPVWSTNEVITYEKELFNGT